MTGLQVTFKDGIPAHVAEIHILGTNDGQLAGTMTGGTRHRIRAYAELMKDLLAKAGVVLERPELVDEAQLRGIPEEEVEYIRRHTELGLCLKELHLVATLHVTDEDYCHIIRIHWLQTGRELAGTPLAALVQDVVGRLSFGELHPFFEHVDWLEMY